MANYDAAHADDHHGEHKQSFFQRWFYSTNHKDIGTLYLVFSLVMFFIGGSLALVIRGDLFLPGLVLVERVFFIRLPPC